MSANQFAYATVCTTGILLIELVPSKASQSTDLPSNLSKDSVSTTLASSRNELASADHKPSSKPAHIAEPERLNEFEFPLPSSASNVVTSPSNLVETDSTNSGVLASVAVSSSQTTQSVPDSQPVHPIKQHEAIAIVSKPETIAISPKSLSNSTAPISTQVKGVIASTRANDLIPLSAPTLASSGSSGASKEIDQVPLSNAVNSTPPTILPRAGVEFTAGDTIGNPNSLGGINGFIPLAQTPGRNITFAEGRVRLSTNNANPSTNLVLGHRIYDSKSDRIFGGYLAFDYRNTGNNGFNQLGFGVEALGKTWDVRANVYLPLGNNRQLASESTNRSTLASTEPFFQQNFLATTRTIQEQINQQFEAAVGGFDVEAGGKLAKLGGSGELRGYGGIYYLKAPESDGAMGVRGRLEARITDNVQAGLVVSHDGMFGTNVALTVGFTMPTTRPRRSTLKEPFLARLGDSVNRNSTIAIQEQRESRTVITQATQFVTNPATGQPWRFRHANLGTGIGDGTFENPTGTVAEVLAVAQPDDIVYVQPGTNPGIPTFTIPDRVQVLSTGPVQRIETVEFGNLQLPGSGAGVLPIVQGTAILGNTTTLSGFTIGTATGPGILGNNISTAIVRDNAILNTAVEGILLNNVQGQVIVQDNTIRQAGGEGFSLTNNEGQVDLLLTRNQISNNGAVVPDGDGVNVELRNGATGNFTITNNAITNNAGIGGIADGIDVKLFNNANGAFNVTDNTITENQLNGVAIDWEATTQGIANLSRNVITGNQANGVASLLSNDANGTINLDANTIANNQIKGVQVVVSDRANGTVNLTNNTISTNQDDGFFLQSSNQARVGAQLLNNTLTNNTRYGIFTTANGTSQLRVLIDFNTITDNGFTGISINTTDSASSVVALRSNTVTGNTFGDVESFTTTPSAAACLQPLNNTIRSLFLDDSFGGPISVEAGALPTNSITTSDLIFWSSSTVAPGTCGF